MFQQYKFDMHLNLAVEPTDSNLNHRICNMWNHTLLRPYLCHIAYTELL